MKKVVLTRLGAIRPRTARNCCVALIPPICAYPLAAAVDGAAEGGGEQYERARMERQGEVYDAVAMSLPHITFSMPTICTSTRMRWLCGDAQSRPHRRAQGHVVPKGCDPIGRCARGVEGAAHLAGRWK